MPLPIEVTGPHGIATVATVRDTPLTQKRHTVTLRRGRRVVPCAVFLASPARGEVQIGSATIHKGTLDDAVAFAEVMVHTAPPEDLV